MKLSEDQVVVDALKRILEDYGYLKYDEVGSRNRDFLRVKVTYLDAERDRSITDKICEKLAKTTGRHFRPVGIAKTDPNSNSDSDWTHFNIRVLH